MRVPTGQYEGLEWYTGARHFWRKELQRLKFWNPTLPAVVDTVRSGANEPLYISVEYESANREALSQLKINPYPKPQLSVKKPKTLNPAYEGSLDPRRRQQRARDPRRPVPKVKDIEPFYFPEGVLEHAPRDEIKEVALLDETTTATAKTAAQGTSPSKTLFTRTVTIPLAGLRHIEIWNWIRQHTNLRDHRSIPTDELKAYQEVARFKTQGEKDRKRVKTAMDAMKKEQAELKKARAAAEAIAAEAV